MVLEKAEPESSVFPSNGGRYVYGVVPHGLPVFYPASVSLAHFNRKCTDERKKECWCALMYS